MEIFADLNSSGIYLSGETVKCQVTFFNTHEFHPETVQDKLEHLAWASVQIQCICQVATPSGTGEQIVKKLSILGCFLWLRQPCVAFLRSLFRCRTYLCSNYTGYF